MRLTDLPLDRPVATVMLLVCLSVLGGVAIAYLPLGFLPVVAEPEIDVYVPFPGSHPLEGLREIVRPIEEEIATIPDVKMIFAWCDSGQAGNTRSTGSSIDEACRWRSSTSSIPGGRFAITRARRDGSTPACSPAAGPS